MRGAILKSCVIKDSQKKLIYCLSSSSIWIDKKYWDSNITEDIANTFNGLIGRFTIKIINFKVSEDNSNFENSLSSQNKQSLSLKENKLIKYIFNFAKSVLDMIYNKNNENIII